MSNVLVLVAAGIALFLFTRLVVYAERYRRSVPRSDLRELITLCRGDRGVARRLVALERSRVPELTEEKAIRRALDRVRRDHGR